ncbi:glycosyltransferase family 2 protein [Cylindrospermum sp. FACHB-282]|uniref:glycosyltransferase family 2 protein n=1 Tax=Cylindrospermum sp. FACHB-282 TaxID=2692794 RepID=UPI001687A51A|nr:glycosyltransferase family A protein [Cylindrospermum sp. FACHB-282]MBD2388333.1 glycosyltransferase family 2 protein [Cylindrospermum sp. FACHB-282]
MPKVSVVIPAYNAMIYLPDTLASVLQQTFTDFEVFIINDGSTDNIKQWATQIVDPRVKLISQQNQGVSAARNTGIAHSTGEFVAFLDADDLWKPTKLEKQVHCLEDNSAVGLVYTWTAFIDQSGKFTGILLANHVEGNVWEQIVVLDMISTGSSPMVRRNCFDTVGLFDPNIRGGEDRDMWSRIAAHYPFKVVKEPLTLYRRHSSNTTKNSNKMLQELRLVIEKTFQSAPIELLYLRTRSYGWMNIFAAWSSLLDESNLNQAMHYRQQAILHYPQLRYTSIYIRLSLAIAITYSFGTQGYARLQRMTHRLRRLMLDVAT